MKLRVLFFAVGAWLASTTAWAYNFSVSQLQGVTLSPSTSLQFGPDNRLYVSQVNGQIKALTVQRLGPNNYQVTATETINLVRDIPNYDDDGTRNYAQTTRQVTGLLVVGTAANPILYVSSSDPRIGGGSGGNDLNVDTNSGIISRLTRSGTTWSKVDLVRGLPRSEENHSTNGMQLDQAHNILYVAQGGNTNAGGPSNNFAFMCETALSAAILSVDLNAIDAMPLKTDAYGQKYLYDLPTLDDPNPDRAHNPDGTNANDPFGGNDGLNQAKLVEGGPVQVYSSGFRNPYDVVLTRTPGREGRLYTIDNGANNGWGGYPKNEGSPSVTNEYVSGEPGAVNDLDNLHLITGPGYYGGHPNPVRANPAGAGWFHFDDSMPEGSQKIFSFNPTSDWPSVPVSMADPQQADFRQPGVDDGALITYTSSTNGLTEYVGTNFSGAMQGNLIAACYDGQIVRIALNAAGTAVTNGNEILATGFGALPLDVTAPDPGHGADFVGTLWVVHYSPAKISILEPEDFDSPGSSTCTGINSYDVDEDGDGYSNADEIASGSDPCSGAIRPPDADEDHISDLTDTDDDNDGIPDTQDPFPIDALNGKNIGLPAHFELFNDTGYGFFGVGMTGVMMNRGNDYLPLITPNNVIAGGTSGLFTIAETGPGTARGNANAQKDAYQFAINSDEFTAPYVISSRLGGPFFNSSPTANQTQGIYLGTGDQDNYVSVALNANNGAGGIEIIYEKGGVISFQHMYSFPELSTVTTVDLFFRVDPVAGTVQPGYRTVDDAPMTPLGDPILVSGDTLVSLMGPTPLAIGLFANTGGSSTPTFSATWDYFDIAPETSTALAKLTIDPTGSDMATSSTYATNAFKIQNLSTGGQQISSFKLDLSTSILPDLVFDPAGTAGDPDHKAFQINSSAGGISGVNGFNTKPHNGTDSGDGYDELDVNFATFPAGGTLGFSIDVDPNSVKGAAAPGPGDSASVSGLELIGATAEVFFSDGSVYRTRLTRLEGTNDASYGWLRADKPPKPGIAIVGKTSPAQTGQQETIRVSGPPGLNVTLTTIEAALYTAGVPGGGYQVQPYDANTAIKITEDSGVIPDAGYLDFAVMPTKSNSNAGYNFITAVLSNGANIKGPASDRVELWYDPSFGNDVQPPTTPGNLAASDVTSRSVTLTWAASTDNTGVTAYDVLRNGNVVTSTTGLSYTDIGLDPGIVYNYSVIARDAVGNNSTPATTSATTIDSGTVVLRVNTGGPAYTDKSGKSWSADTGYNTGGTTTTTVAIDRTIDDKLFQSDRYDSTTSPELTYSFSVANGDYEVQLFFAEVYGPTSAVGQRQFNILLEGEERFHDFDIFALAGAPATAVMVADSVTVTDGQLNIGFTHDVQNPKVNAIKVIKLNSTGTGDTTPPTAPGSLTFSNVTASSVTLNWTAATDNVGVAGYRISREGVTVDTVTGLTFTDTGLAASTTYNYSVVALDAAGNVSPASTGSTTTSAADNQAPTAPGALTFSNVTASGVTVNWTAATDNVGVTGYRVSRDGVVLSTVNALTYVDSGLDASTTYSYSIVALDAAGNASPASTGSVSTAAGGGTTLPTIRVNAGGPKYTDPAGHVWSADTGYNTGETYSTSASISGTTTPTLFKTERFDRETSPELNYTFSVPNGNYLVHLLFSENYSGTSGTGLRVFDIDINSQRAFEDVDIYTLAGGANKALTLEKAVTVTNGQIKIGFVHQTQNPKINAIEIVPDTSTPPPTDTQPPTAPGSLTFSNVTASSVTLNWSAATDNVGVTGYRVSRDGATIATVTGLSYDDTGLTAATSYNYSVVALDAAGNVSPASSATIATASGGTTLPTIRVNAGGSSYTDTAGHTWSADTGYNTGKTYSSSATISGTSDQALFQKERYDEPASPELTYTFTVPNGAYLVHLLFAENYSGASGTGLRVFDIDINSQRAFEDVDIFTLAGGANQALTLEKAVNVTGGQIKIAFVHQTQNPKINAIEIVPDTGTPPADTQAPTAPGSLTFTNVTSTSVTLNWAAATDNVGVTGYRISRDGAVVTTVTGLSYNDTGLTAGTAYNYSVVALDAAGNVSPASTGSISTASGAPTLAVTNLMLLNANSDQDLRSLTDGATIDLSTDGTALNIRADVSGTAGSVAFILDGSTYRVENAAPYAIGGDSNGNFSVWTPTVGAHTLNVIPYSGTNRSGTMGAAVQITFTVQN